jgi:16S rRNA (adenine1518-N6/adenine1519-N6)-dimethyltransferase
MLRSALKPLGDPERLLAEAGVSSDARAEEVPVEGFAALARALDGRPGENPTRSGRTT